MKKLIAYIAALFLIFSMFAGIPGKVLAVGTTYYIDTAGNNGNNGITPETAWADFTNINNRNFNNGDILLFKRGCTWTATSQAMTMGTINGSGVTVDAYGSGVNPVFSGGAYTGCSAFGYSNRDDMTFQNMTFDHMLVTSQFNYTTFGHTGLTYRNLTLINSYIVVVNRVADTGQTLLSEVVIENINSTNSNNTGCININTFLTDDITYAMASEESVKNVTFHNVYIENTAGCGLSLTNCSDVTLSNVRVNNDCSTYAPQGTTAVFLWKTDSLNFINCAFTYTPDSESVDQCAIDHEAFINASIYKGCYFGDNSGAGLEFLGQGHANDFNTNHQVNSCTFVNNGTAGSSQFRGSLYRDDYYGGFPFSGTASNNVFSETNYPGNGNGGFTNQWNNGNFNYWTLSNNTSIPSAENISNSEIAFSATQGLNNWFYQTYDGSTWTNLSYNSSNGYFGTTSALVSPFETLPDAVSSHSTARVYVAPYPGIVNISGWAYLPYNNSGTDGVRIKITKNGSTIWGTNTISGTDAAGIAANISDVTLAAGDIIRFQVDCGSNNNNSSDNVSWIPTIAYKTIEKPVSEWKLDGNTNDSTGSNSGTTSGGVTFTAGKKNDAANLNGTNGYISIPDSVSLDSMSKLTLSVWVKMTQLPSAGNYYIVMGKEDGTGSGAYRIALYSNGTGHIALATTNNSWYSAGTTAAWTTQMQTGTWYHIVATYDGSYVRIYVNGSLQGTGTQSISGTVVRYAQPVRLGYQPSFSYFNGMIDDAKIYTLALNSSGVQNLYNIYQASLYTSPDHEWRFDNNTKDSTGNKDAGTSGGISWGAGKKVNAIGLNGSSGYVSIPDNNTLDSMSKLTLSVWVKMNQLPSAGNNYVIAGKEDGTGSGAYRLCVGSNGTGHIAVATTNNSWYSAGTTASWTTQMQTGNWYHIAATYDGSYVRIYVNGSLQGTGSQSISGNIIRYAQPLRFGYEPSFNYFNGYIDDVRIYDGALDSTGVSNLYGSY
ncbi:MAG: LamG domain-containing protein [Saccharofermentanales bacterium]